MDIAKLLQIFETEDLGQPEAFGKPFFKGSDRHGRALLDKNVITGALQRLFHRNRCR